MTSKQQPSASFILTWHATAIINDIQVFSTVFLPTKKNKLQVINKKIKNPHHHGLQAVSSNQQHPTHNSHPLRAFSWKGNKVSLNTKYKAGQDILKKTYTHFLLIIYTSSPKEIELSFLCYSNSQMFTSYLVLYSFFNKQIRVFANQSSKFYFTEF